MIFKGLFMVAFAVFEQLLSHPSAGVSRKDRSKPKLGIL